jgi:E3 ubiquitin-protein ligase UBR4
MELLELLVCGRIIALDIPVRVVQRELWRTHVLDTHVDDYDSDCGDDVLPPMTVTYRLAGVDGEATEEVVETLTDSAAQVCAQLLAWI